MQYCFNEIVNLNTITITYFIYSVMFLTSFPLSRTRGQMREVPIRVESDSTGLSRESVGINRSPEERIIPTNATHAEHRDFGIFSFSNLPFIRSVTLCFCRFPNPTGQTAPGSPRHPSVCQEAGIFVTQGPCNTLTLWYLGPSALIKDPPSPNWLID